MSSRRLISVALPAVLFAVTAAFVAALLAGHGTTGPLGSGLAIGTLSSLAATAIAAVIKVVTAAQAKPQSDAASFPGLLRISRKSDFTSEDWLQLLRNANTEFYLAGHTLGKWCSASNRDAFKSHVTRILNDSGRVTLVMLAPTSAQISRLQQATSVDYTDRIDTSHIVLAELTTTLQPAARAGLQICVIDDDPALPYLVVGNEQRLVTATYLATTDSDDVACLELERSSSAATAVYDDFQKLAQSGKPAILPTTPTGQSAPQAVVPLWRRRFHK